MGHLGRGIIIQARMSSKRFPDKMMAPLDGVPLIEYVYNRCKRSNAGRVLVATSDGSSDDMLYGYCKKNMIPVMRGDLNNVVARYVKAAQSEKIGYIGRVCGDSPFVDTSLIDLSFEALTGKGLDYAAPGRETCASGFYSETFTLKALEKVLMLAKTEEDFEHVTKYMLENKNDFSIELIDAGLNPAFVRTTRFTIDYPEDMELANRIASELPGGYSFDSGHVLDALRKAIRT